VIRYLVLAAICLAVLGGVGLVLARHDAHDAPAAVPPVAVRPALQPTTPAASAHVVVGDITGRLEKRQGDTWVPLAKGDPLDARDEIRTADDATAIVEFGDYSVDLDRHTQVMVGEVREQSIKLAEGRVSASGKGHVRIYVTNSDAYADATDSKFAVATTGHGDIVAAAETGTVKLTAKGKTVDVHEGEVSSAAADSEPTTPTKIPASLFLKVSATGGGHQKLATLKAETTPGAIVDIGGVRTIAAGGVVETQVPLKEGKNAILVVVEDVRGRRETRTLERVVDTRKPTVNAKVEW
jgi:hypothetical protein